MLKAWIRENPTQWGGRKTRRFFCLQDFINASSVIHANTALQHHVLDMTENQIKQKQSCFTQQHPESFNLTWLSSKWWMFCECFWFMVPRGETFSDSQTFTVAPPWCWRWLSITNQYLTERCANLMAGWQITCFFHSPLTSCLLYTNALVHFLTTTDSFWFFLVWQTWGWISFTPRRLLWQDLSSAKSLCHNCSGFNS